MTRTAKIGLRIACILAVAACIAFGLNRSSARLNHDLRPAGFVKGMIQGALMPLSLPNLVLGNDVTIYAPNNTGRTYKLGYSLGVNLCGAVFFGFFFWRVAQWGKKRGASERPSVER